MTTTLPTSIRKIEFIKGSESLLCKWYRWARREKKLLSIPNVEKIAFLCYFSFLSVLVIYKCFTKYQTSHLFYAWFSRVYSCCYRWSLTLMHSDVFVWDFAMTSVTFHFFFSVFFTLCVCIAILNHLCPQYDFLCFYMRKTKRVPLYCFQWFRH